MKIRKIIKNMLYPNFKNSDTFRQYLINKGASIGKGTYFFDPKNTHIDEENIQFVSIGDYCKITTGVYILAHDYSYSVLRRAYNDIPKKAALTKIGNNCFIGINSIILMGADIGNNVIIGAGSVVSGKIPDNEVWGGNPVRFICKLEDYYRKCKNNFETSASTFVNQYVSRYHKIPNIQEMQYFSLLFLNNDIKFNNEEEYRKMKFSGDNKNEVINVCLDYKSKYDSYMDFLENNLNLENKSVLRKQKNREREENDV